MAQKARDLLPKQTSLQLAAPQVVGLEQVWLLLKQEVDSPHLSDSLVRLILILGKGQTPPFHPPTAQGSGVGSTAMIQPS